MLLQKPSTQRELNPRVFLRRHVLHRCATTTALSNLSCQHFVTWVSTSSRILFYSDSKVKVKKPSSVFFLSINVGAGKVRRLREETQGGVGIDTTTNSLLCVHFCSVCLRQSFSCVVLFFLTLPPSCSSSLSLCFLSISFLDWYS